MTPDPNLFDDPVIRRVAAVRPVFPQADLDPRHPLARESLSHAMSAAPGPSARACPVRRRRAIAIAVAGIVAIALVLTAVLRGPAGTGTQPAVGAIVRHVEQELITQPGTIVVQRVHSSLQEPNKPISRYSDYYVTEAVPDSTVQNILQYGTGLGVSASIDGDEEMYLPQTNTIYISNPYAPYIHPGPRPGTYVYRAGRGSPTPAFTSSFTLTVAEVRSLESGHTEILPHQLADGHFKLEIHTPPREPATEAQDVRDEIHRHQLHFDGRVRLDGHSAFRFDEIYPSQEATTSLYVNPETYAPVKIVTHNRVVGGAVDNTALWTEYKVLPITAQNKRLLSLRALHPSARIDHNRGDFLRAQG